MAFCTNCGAPIKEDQKFCGNCGAPINKTNEEAKEEQQSNNFNSDQQGNYNEAPGYEPISEEVFETTAKKGKLNIGMLVWAIINTVISFCSCCLPFGIIPLIFSLMTNSEDYEVSQKNRKRALVWNIVVSSLILFVTVFEIVFVVFFADEFEQWAIEYAGGYGYDVYEFYY